MTSKKTSVSVRKPKAKPKKPLINYVALVLDSSGSMGWLRQQAVAWYNQAVKDLKENAKSSGQRTYVTVITFDTRATVLQKNIPIENLGDLSYHTGGGTALFDAINSAIDNLDVNENSSGLVLCYTDGEENSSTIISGPRLNAQLLARMREGNWTVTIQTPPTGRQILLDAGINADNILCVEPTKEGLEYATKINTCSLQSFYTARGAGAKSVTNFYADVDLHDLKPTELKKNLDDVTTLFKEYKVEKECNVTEFYEEKMKKIYSKGDVYYLLTKKETVQAKKDIVLNKKGERAIYGGETVRDIIGIPKGQDGKVSPLNLSYYNVYIESTSDNRKLVRGTTALIRR